MASKKQYEVDKKKKVVKANIARLSEKELQAVSNFVKLGYELVEGTIKPKSKGLYTKANIEKFVKANKKDFDLKALANELNEDGNKKGFIYAQKVFRSLFEDEFLEFLEK